jgi:hypothetical protein
MSSSGAITITVRDTPEGEAICYYSGPPPTGSSLSPAQRLAFSVLCDLQEEGVELIVEKAQVDRVVDGNVVRLIRKEDERSE